MTTPAADLTGQRERGSAMILSIIVLMGLGLIALNSLQRQLTSGMGLTSNQHRYVIAWSNASSALSWGIRQRWKGGNDTAWQCQNVTEGLIEKGTGRACIRPSLREDVFLIRGEGKMDVKSGAVYLFQQVGIEKQADGTGIFSPLKQGWLDFCPETDEFYCD